MIYIVGAGLTGATIAYLLSQQKLPVVVIEKRDHLGGNCHTELIEGIMVHKYGPHIFHTNNDNVWKFVNKFARFNSYTHEVKACHDGEIYPFPINLATVNQFYKGYLSLSLTRPEDMRKLLEDRTLWAYEFMPTNAWEFVASKVGHQLAEAFYKGYSEKQWGRPMEEIPMEIVSRIPIRYNWDGRYFTDKYQGIPTTGYTQMVKSMLLGIPVELNTPWDVFISQIALKSEDRLFYTGPVDAYFGFRLGKLDYRSLEFYHHTLVASSKEGIQGCAQMNYTDPTPPFTRTIEHKHFLYDYSSYTTVITTEFPADYEKTGEPFYPVRDQKNSILYKSYLDLAKKEAPNVTFCGRLGSYMYLNMDVAIGAAMNVAAKFIQEYQ